MELLLQIHLLHKLGQLRVQSVEEVLLLRTRRRLFPVEEWEIGATDKHLNNSFFWDELWRSLITPVFRGRADKAWR